MFRNDPIGIRTSNSLKTSNLKLIFEKCMRIIINLRRFSYMQSICGNIFYIQTTSDANTSNYQQIEEVDAVKCVDE